MRAAVVVLAAGAGSRVGASVNKVLLPLAGVPVVARSVQTACAVPGVRRVVLVVRDGEQDTMRRAVEPHLPGPAGEDHDPPEVAMVTGGTTRHASEWAALSLLAPEIEAGVVDVVAIHDAARPLASVALYDAVLRTAHEFGGAIPVAYLDDLVAADGSDLPELLAGVQTPQAFQAAVLLAAHRAAAADGFEATDTAGCLAAYTDVTVSAVESNERNLKLTVTEDFRVAEALIASPGPRAAAGPPRT
jgi:2-C-methyl-D-erythritol 4-phosphate cytidylyltransferase